MNHLQNFSRFVIVIGWLVIVGVLFTAFSHLGNVFALSWVTLLFYVSLFAFVVYCGIFLTKHFWNIK